MGRLCFCVCLTHSDTLGKVWRCHFFQVICRIIESRAPVRGASGPLAAAPLSSMWHAIFTWRSQSGRWIKWINKCTTAVPARNQRPDTQCRRLTVGSMGLHYKPRGAIDFYIFIPADSWDVHHHDPQLSSKDDEPPIFQWNQIIDGSTGAILKFK